MDFAGIFEQINLESDIVAYAIVLALAVILWINHKRIGILFREWRIQRNLKKIGAEQIRNLVCPDGLDGYFKLDRLALTRDAILLISYKAYGGNIYCAENISEWTQVIEQKSYKFENPLFDLENQLTALRLIMGNVPLRGYLYFNHSAEFPKGHPDSVIHPGNIPESILHQNCTSPRADIQAAWEQLKLLQQEASSGPAARVKT